MCEAAIIGLRSCNISLPVEDIHRGPHCAIRYLANAFEGLVAPEQDCGHDETEATLALTICLLSGYGGFFM